MLLEENNPVLIKFQNVIVKVFNINLWFHLLYNRAAVVKHSTDEKGLGLLENLEKLLHCIVRILCSLGFSAEVIKWYVINRKTLLNMKKKLCNIWEQMKAHTHTNSDSNTRCDAETPDEGKSELAKETTEDWQASLSCLSTHSASRLILTHPNLIQDSKKLWNIFFLLLWKVMPLQRQHLRIGFCISVQQTQDSWKELTTTLHYGIWGVAFYFKWTRHKSIPSPFLLV